MQGNSIRVNVSKMERRWKAVIIGLGNIGYGLSRYDAGFAVTHFEAYIDNKQTDLVAVSDIDAKAESLLKKRSDYKKINFYNDWRAMIKSENPEIVSICTPDETHYKILKGITENSCVKAIWCEKPLAQTLKQGREMVALCKTKNIKLAVNYIRRYDEFYRKVRGSLEKLLGEVMVAICYYSGGITTNGSHMVDILNFLFGNCVLARGVGSAGEITGLLEFEKCKTAAVVPIASAKYSIFEMSILGENGRLNIYGKPFNGYEYQYLVPQKSAKININFLSSKSKTPFSRNLKRNYMSNALADITDSITNNGDPFSSGETALNSLEILSALTCSASRDGKSTYFPFAKINTKIPKARGDLKTWQKKN